MQPCEVPSPQGPLGSILGFRPSYAHTDLRVSQACRRRRFGELVHPKKGCLANPEDVHSATVP